MERTLDIIEAIVSARDELSGWTVADNARSDVLMSVCVVDVGRFQPWSDVSNLKLSSNVSGAGIKAKNKYLRNDSNMCRRSRSSYRFSHEEGAGSSSRPLAASHEPAFTCKYGGLAGELC